jgi:hypothetical protein
MADRAPTADGLGLGDLNVRQAAVAYGEEQIGVEAHASSLFTPVRGVVALCSSHGREDLQGLSSETGHLAGV